MTRMAKRMLTLLAALTLSSTLLPGALAAEKVSDSNRPVSEEQAALMDLHVENNHNKVIWEPLGPEYEEPSLSDFSMSSPALYTCTVAKNYSLFAAPYDSSDEAARAERVLPAQSRAYQAEVLFVGQAFVVVRAKGVIGFVKRDFISEVTPIDPATAPYGVQKPAYLATTAAQAWVRKSMSDEDDSWVILNPGTKLTIWKIQDGWAIVLYKRTFGYIDMRQLTDLVPVSPTDTPIREDSPIAAYTSYYNMDRNWENVNRITNIRVGCERLTRVMQPGEQFDFNADVGPYKAANGYFQAPVLLNGESVPGYGGGTCQVSSTLYNALIQLTGITIDERRAHGPSGAKYLPHGVDAAVGSKDFNLRFTNSYDFPIRIEGHSSDDGALLMLIYRAD